jgi:hypothetical protein
MLTVLVLTVVVNEGARPESGVLTNGGSAMPFVGYPSAACGESGTPGGALDVRTVAEAHGGSSHLANREPAGTDAWVSLPSHVHERVMLRC